MRFVVINAQQRYYAVFEGRRLVAGYTCETVLGADEVESLRMSEPPGEPA